MNVQEDDDGWMIASSLIIWCGPWMGTIDSSHVSAILLTLTDH